MLCEGAFPSARSIEALDGEEEERRLFYVAVTRARSQLYLSYPLLRVTAGSDELIAKAVALPVRKFPRTWWRDWNLKMYLTDGRGSGWTGIGSAKPEQRPMNHSY